MWTSMWTSMWTMCLCAYVVQKFQKPHRIIENIGFHIVFCSNVITYRTRPFWYSNSFLIEYILWKWTHYKNCELVIMATNQTVTNILYPKGRVRYILLYMKNIVPRNERYFFLVIAYCLFEKYGNPQGRYTSFWWIMKVVITTTLKIRPHLQIPIVNCVCSLAFSAIVADIYLHILS